MLINRGHLMSRLEKPIYALLKNEPFFAHFLLGCRFTFDHPKVKTAGVSVQRGEINFFIDSEWYFSRTLTEQSAVLKHEVFHLLLEHCGPRGKSVDNKAAANIAMDCAINQHIPGLPVGAVTLQMLEKLVKKPLSSFQNWEYYYNEMKAAIKEANEPHDHDVMQEGENGNEESDFLSEQIGMAVKDAAGKAVQAACGNIPDALVSVLGALNKAARIPWKQQLRNFVSSARSAKSKNTRMKPNRRFDLEQPGKKKIRELVLGVCCDSSGSVSDESYSDFMAEIAQIIKSTKITYLVDADCAVQKINIIRDGKAKPGVLTTRNGGGGTAYQPAIDECMKRKCDAIIYFGDFDTADLPKNPGVPFIWVGVGSSPPPADFGKVIRL